uniref:FIVAR domain-containing protein n=1 Tax=Lachnoclostridium phocaeense TaxID=1871021 RepID=UPI0026DAFE9D|nr:FIVAR domain-containing protein [Lachnoclostridium phocaeense]
MRKSRFASHPALARGGLAALTAISAGIIAASAYGSEWAIRQNQTLQKTEAHLIQNIDNEKKDRNSFIQDAETLVSSVTEEQVADPDVLISLKKILGEEKQDTPVHPTDVKEATAGFYRNYCELKSSIQDNRTILKDMEDCNERLSDIIKKVEVSKHAKDLENSRNALTDEVDSAKETLTSSEGKVADNATRGTLQETITKAEEVLSREDVDDISVYNNAKKNIEEAKTSVEASIAKQQEIEASAARRASAARYASEEAAKNTAGNGGQAKKSGDGTWYVDYSNAYYTGSAAADGSVTQWADGYYIAHSWSSGGQAIASRPGTVVVNGRTYRYVSSMVVPEGTTWDSVSGFVHANGGIGFQTCVDGGYLITHYEPV